MAESPYDRRKRLDAERARKRRIVQQEQAAEQRDASSRKNAGRFAAVKKDNPYLGAKGFGNGPMGGTVPKKATDSAAAKAVRDAARAKPAAKKTTAKSTAPAASPRKTASPAARTSSPVATPTPAKKTVDQSRTMWVKAGTKLSDGSTVKQGYVAQLGKPEKKVTANIKIQTDTTSGKKAGDTYQYNKGRTVGQVKKPKK